MGSDDQSDLAQRLEAMFPPGRTIDDGCAVVEARRAPKEVVLLVRWKRDPRLYGIPISLTDTREDFYYTGHRVSSDEEWLESVDVGLMVHMGTGFRARARRRELSEYIELRDDGGWPTDERFYLQGVDYEPERVAQALECDGLHAQSALQRRAEGRLLAWVLAYENNATGEPNVGHAVVVRLNDKEAVLEHLEVAPDVPVTVKLDLAYFACHEAAAAGALTIVTDLDDAELGLAGFRSGTGGARLLDTSFLDADPDGARALLENDLGRGSRWGQNRDSGGRHMPRSRLGRAWHVVRFGKSGKPPRRWAG